MDEKKTPPVPEKELTRVTSQPVKKREKKGLAKLFLAEDWNVVAHDVLMDIVLPEVKELMGTAISSGVYMLLGIDSSKQKRQSTGRASSIRYWSPPKTETSAQKAEKRVQRTYDFNDLEPIPDKFEAEEVLAQLDELISVYGRARVADYYQLVGVTGDATANDYGWKNLREAYVYRVRGGYAIRMPRARPLA